MDVITQEDLFEAGIRSDTFYKNFETLYGLDNMSFNVHISKHAVDCASRWGPQWAYSTYGFEGANGGILNMFNGTQAIDIQMANKFLNTQHLKALTAHFSQDSPFIAVQKRLLGEIKPTKKAMRAGTAVFIGKSTARLLTPEELLALQSFSDLNCTNHVRFFQKMLTNSNVFASHSYKPETRRQNCYVKLKGGVFCRIACMCAIPSLSQCRDPEPVAFAKHLQYANVSKLKGSGHLIEISNDHDESLIAFKPSSITSKLIVVSSNPLVLSALPTLLDRD
jgi:hypothetical protein